MGMHGCYLLFRSLATTETVCSWGPGARRLGSRIQNIQHYSLLPSSRMCSCDDIIPLIFSEPVPFIKVGSSRLYFEKAPSSYEKAIQTCLKHGSRLLEIHDQEEWSNVRAPLFSCHFFLCFTVCTIHTTHYCLPRYDVRALES